MEIFPSLISSDLLNLERTIKLLDPYCHGYHIDIMDDHFVPNLTWGAGFVNAILRATNKSLYVHLMVDTPELWIDRVSWRREDVFVFHVELFSDSQRIDNLIQDVKSKGCRVGIALNPATEINLVFNYLKDLDNILLMSVNPGFSGQKFISDVIKKIDPLIKKREELKLDFKIGMDGGIKKDNIMMLSELGVEQFGVASAIFSKDDYVKALQELRTL